MVKKKLKINFSELLKDPEYQKISKRILSKTGRLKEKDYTRQFTI